MDAFQAGDGTKYLLRYLPARYRTDADGQGPDAACFLLPATCSSAPSRITAMLPERVVLVDMECLSPMGLKQGTSSLSG